MSALTMDQAINGQRFHFDMAGCTDPERGVDRGKTGKAQPKARVFDWRRNGRTQTWKTRPGAFSIPVKYGMYDYGRITENDHVHLADDCPSLRVVSEYWEAQR